MRVPAQRKKRDEDRAAHCIVHGMRARRLRQRHADQNEQTVMGVESLEPVSSSSSQAVA
jgi:hypothetical protein